MFLTDNQAPLRDGKTARRLFVGIVHIFLVFYSRRKQTSGAGKLDDACPSRAEYKLLDMGNSTSRAPTTEPMTAEQVRSPHERPNRPPRRGALHDACGANFPCTPAAP